MAFEYEALVGYLVIVGGRAINASPPGALVEVAPRKAARGREVDTFFAFVLPSGEQTAPAAFYEQMANTAVEKYFATTGSVTSALRAVFQHLNENLYEHNLKDKRRFEASIVCAVLRGAEVFVARVGAAIALYRFERDVQAFPADFDNDEALFGPPLGVQPVPEVKMATYKVSSGTRLLIADANLADLSQSQAGVCLGGSDIAAVLASLKALVPINLMSMAVEFVPPEVPVPIPVRAVESSREAASKAPPAPPPPPTAAPQVPPPSSTRTRSRIPLSVQSTAGAAAGLGAKVTSGLLKLLDRFVPPLAEGKKGWFASSSAVLAAVLIPVAVVLFVLVMWITGMGESEFDLCVRRAQEGAVIARGIISSDIQGTLNAWTAAAQVARECQALRPDTPDETLTAISTEAQTVTDRLMVITRREMTTVASFPQAGLSSAVLQGQDLYVLDNGNDQVYRITLSPDGLSMMPNTRQALAFMRRNAQLGEYQVGDLIDIAWAEDGSGFSQANVLVGIDRNGLVIDCAPRFTDSCRGQQLIGVENWLSPIKIHIWNGRLYVLDPAANQLWRYDPPGPNSGAFPNAPLEYFSGEGRPDIRTAVDFSIDTEGVVYILLANGTVWKFRGGDRLDFAFAGFPQGQPLAQADAFFLNTNPLRPALYIVDRSNLAIYETLLGGTFVHNFRATNPTYFESLSDVLVNNNQEVIYALSGNSVFAFLRDS